MKNLHKNLFFIVNDKGQALMNVYRVVGRKPNKEIIWLQTEASMVRHSSKTNRTQYYVSCCHQILRSDFLRSNPDLKYFWHI